MGRRLAEDESEHLADRVFRLVPLLLEGFAAVRLDLVELVEVAAEVRHGQIELMPERAVATGAGNAEVEADLGDGAPVKIEIQR